MEATHLLGAALGLLLALGIGTVAHEFVHALALRALGVPYVLEWCPDTGEQAHLNVGLLGAWATVTPTSIPQEVPVWGLRVSALAPLMLTVPVLLVPLGLAPDPLASGNVIYVAITVAWLGCAIPSPQDFSLFWHAEQVIEQHTGENHQ